MAEITLVKKDGSLTLGGRKYADVKEVYVGDTAPTDENIQIWVNPNGDIPDNVATHEYVDEKIKNIDLSDLEIDMTGYATETYVDEKVANVQVDLTGYATEEFVNSAIETIELTPGPTGEPGPQGEPGEAGKDGYTPVKGTDYWTTEDKAAMVQDVLNALPAAENVEV